MGGLQKNHLDMCDVGWAYTGGHEGSSEIGVPNIDASRRESLV